MSEGNLDIHPPSRGRWSAVLGEWIDEPYPPSRDSRHSPAGPRRNEDSGSVHEWRGDARSAAIAQDNLP